MFAFCRRSFLQKIVQKTNSNVVSNSMMGRITKDTGVPQVTSGSNSNKKEEKESEISEQIVIKNFEKEILKIEIKRKKVKNYDKGKNDLKIIKSN